MTGVEWERRVDLRTDRHASHLAAVKSEATESLCDCTLWRLLHEICWSFGIGSAGNSLATMRLKLGPPNTAITQTFQFELFRPNFTLTSVT